MKFQVIFSIIGTILLLFQSIKVTINYLNFESIIVTTISDTILYEEPIPDIITRLNPLDFNREKTLNRSEYLKLEKNK